MQQAVGSTLIQKGAITTEKIATGSITAESGIIGSINAGTILFGEMDGARIKAKSIRSDQLLIGGIDNLLPGAAENWASGNEGWSEFEQELYGGLKVKGSKILHNDDEFYVPAGEYLLEATLDASVPGTSCVMQLEGLGGGSARWWPDGSGWQTFDYALNIEEGGYTRLTVFANYSDGASNDDGYQWFSNVSLRSKAGATLIQDGAITTGKIAVGAITAESGIIGSLDAGVITTGELRGELIRAESIAAAALAADAIDGKTITGAIVRTASAGARVEMNNNGLWQYNRFGQVMTEMADGMFTAVGDFQTGLDGERRVVMSNKQFSNAVGLRFYPDSSGKEAGITSMSGSGGWTPGSITVTSASTGGIHQEFSQKAPTSSEYGLTRIGTLEDGSWIGGYLELSENGDARLRSRSSSDLELWSSGDVDIDSDSSVSVMARDGTARLRHSDGSWFGVGVDGSGTKVESATINNRTYSGQSEVVITSNSILGRRTSARKYKLDEQLVSPDDYDDALLSIEHKSWIDKSEYEDSQKLAEYREQRPYAPISQRQAEYVDEADLPRHFGAVADDFDAAGLSQFVIYDDYGQVDGLQYSLIGVALIPIVRGLRDRIESLEAQLSA